MNNNKGMKPNKEGNKIAIFSFFSGAGFLDLGFEAEGYDIVFVNEIYKPFMDGYKYSRKKLGFHEPRFGYSEKDIKIIKEKGSGRLKELVAKARETYELVGFIGGPPCPDFSVAGKNKGRTGKHGILSEVYVDLIANQKPDFFLFENVKGLWRTKIHRQFYEEMKQRLEKAGYSLTEKLINSLEYGAPQERERILLLGFLKMKIGTAENFPWNAARKFKIEDVATRSWPGTEKFGQPKRNKPADIIEELSIQYWFEKNKVEEHPNAGHVFKPRAGLSRFETVEEGDVSKKSYKRLHRWRYSPTAAYGNNEVHLHPFLPRRLTVAEVLAVQSLPRKYELPDTMSLSDMFKAVGNGVPYVAARAIAKTIRNFLQLGDEQAHRPKSGSSNKPTTKGKVVSIH